MFDHQIFFVPSKITLVPCRKKATLLEETIDHLLMHCCKTKGFMGVSLLSFWSGLGPPLAIKEILLGSNGSFVGKEQLKVWKLVP